MPNITRTICGVLVLCLSLWFGGMMALFLFVQVLFHHDREIAIQAAPRLFLAFEQYQLILAAIALIATFAWRLLLPSKLLTSSFVLIALATLLAVYSTSVITPKMESLRHAGQSSGQQFKKLHGISMMMYCSEAVLVLSSGIVVMVVSMRGTAPAAPQARSPRDETADQSEAEPAMGPH
jgi:hypothetical protein